MRRLAPGLAVAVGFVGLAAAFLFPALLLGRVLLPVDNLYQWAPWSAYAGQVGVALPPHNPLISDAVLQNYQWKRFLADQYLSGQLPLWNPYILSGQPFLAAGQNGALYPLGLLFVLLPTAQAFAWFTALHLVIAAASAYYLVRVLGGTRWGGFLTGVCFAFALPMVVVFLWPMVVSTLAWMPLLTALVERTLRAALDEQRPLGDWLPYPALGAAVVGLVFLAGHVEFAFYVLATAGLYAAGRLALHLAIGPRSGGAGVHPVRAALRRLRRAAGAGGALLAMVALGVALAAILLVPFAELAGKNFRTGLISYEEVRSFAFRPQQLAAFVLPNVFGNPTHRTYLDVFDLEERTVEHEFEPEPGRRERATTTEWGAKNYVEGATYVGILPLVLAALALLRQPGRPAVILAGVAVFALLIAFGSPLYALLFYGIPGYNQLHTPFRWVYPYVLAVVALAGLGASAVTREATGSERGQATPQGTTGAADGRERGAVPPVRGGAVAAAEVGQRRLVGPIAVVGGLVGAAGVALLLALATAWLFFERVGPALDELVARSAPLARGFADGRMLFSYQAVGLATLGLLLLASGALLLFHGRLGRLFGPAAVGLVVVDLFAAGAGFNTYGDPAALAFEPPAVQFLAARPGPFRFTTFGPRDTLNSNLGMVYRLEDVRGYDSTILKDYADYLGLIEPQGGLIYNRISKLSDPRSLESPLLHLLNVRYVVTEERLTAPGYRLVYDGEVRIYENDRALPRAFLVTSARLADGPEAAVAQLRRPEFDPGREVVLEPGTEAGSRTVASRAGATSAGAAGAGPVSAEIVSYQPNRVVVRAKAAVPSFLVLGDLYFPGWTATVDGSEAPVLRANRIFRAVALEPGQHEVVFAYRPLSFRLGGLISLVGLVTLGLVGGAWVWGRFPALARPSGAAQTVARNSLLPMATGLVNKFLDFAFMIVLWRILTPEQVGGYQFAVVTVTLLDVLVDFGLGTLITREVARDRASADRYLGATLTLRLGLWAVAFATVLLVAWPLAPFHGMGGEVQVALVLFGVALLPSAAAGAFSGLFRAHERMEVPAAVTVYTTGLKIALGLGALLGGYGIVGLAGVAVVVNLATLGALVGLYWRLIERPRIRLERALLRPVAVLSYPLMLNNLLAGLFYRVDALLLGPLAGERALGMYGTAYKFIDGLNVIPSSFTLAVFPVVSRYAGTSPGAFSRASLLSLRLLLYLALPISVGTTLLAEPIIGTFAGPQYLPDSAWALAVLIWFLPGSFANSLIQYLLIALNRQRYLTGAFVLGAGFNLAANLWAIPRYGYLGAAATTVLSELVLLVPFWWLGRRELPLRALLATLWQPAVAAALMGLALWGTRGSLGLLCVPIGALVYGAALLALGALDAEERAGLLRALGLAGRPLARRSAPPAGLR